MTDQIIKYRQFAQERKTSFEAGLKSPADSRAYKKAMRAIKDGYVPGDSYEKDAKELEQILAHPKIKVTPFKHKVRNFDGSVTEEVINTFCPTGSGGGVDPTCSPKDKKSTSSASKKKAKVVWFSQDDEEMDYDLADEALQVAKRSGINILSDKELTAATIEKGKVTAALFTGLSGDVYSFDVAVDPTHQGKGLGSQLLDLGIREFDNYREMGASMKIDVVNPLVIEMLKRRGFSVTGEFRGHTFLEITTNSRWAFESSQSKVDSFEDWLKAKLSEVLDEKDIHSKTDWWQIYIERAYKFGAARAFDQINKKKVPPTEGFLGAKQFFMGSFPKERLKLLIARTYKGIQGLTDSMRNQLTQELTDGMLQGLTYKQIGERLDQKLNIGLNRAKTIARTEIVRAQAEGQLAAIKALGIEQIGIQVEFNTARKPCPKCQKYNKRILSIKEAEGLIPLHPNCRCAFIPYTTPLPSPQKTAKRKSLEASILATKSRKVGKNK